MIVALLRATEGGNRIRLTDGSDRHLVDCNGRIGTDSKCSDVASFSAGATREVAGYDESARPFGVDLRREASIFSRMNAAPNTFSALQRLC